jgi:tripartite-type tricarboxylate transporter receptor subunit TctC
MKTLASGIALAIALLPAPALGQAYPAKPIRIIAPFPAGGTSDTIARVLGQ